MTKTDRREFLKRAGAGLVGAGAGVLGSSCAGPGERRPEERPAAPGGIPAHRPLALEGLHAYADRQSVEAGGFISFHVSSTEPYRLSICRLGVEIDDPAGDLVVARLGEQPAHPRPIHPGSYIHVEKGLEARAPLRSLALECWLRPFRSTRMAGVITQCDLPHAAGYGLFLYPDGSVGFYLGDGLEFAPSRLALTAARLVSPGDWHHLAAVWDGKSKSLFIDGAESGRWPFPGPVVPGGAPLRLGAHGDDDGRAAGFLDGDIATPAIHSRPLASGEIEERFRARGIGVRNGDGLEAYWPLEEERGERVADISPAARHGRIVNHGTWMVGGPSFVPQVPRFGDYDPQKDARRGHGLRLASDDLYDCHWKVSHRFQIPENARPGYYVARINFALDGEPRVYHVSFVVRAPATRPRPPILLLAATNTWRAYGATPFAAAGRGLRQLAGTDGMPNSPGDPPAYSFYRAHAAGQGTYQVGLRTPWPVAGPYVRYGDRTDYSHLLRAERFAQAWLEKSGYEFDVVTDLDLHKDPALPKGYRVLVLNGHSEYWSREMYEGVQSYLAGGGNLLCLSGNTMFWRVSIDEEGGVLECRKVDAPGDQMPPERRGECWHSHDGRRGGLLNECGLPGWRLVGLTTLGWNNHGDPDHFSPFVVEDPEHFLFQSPVPVGVAKGDPIGQAAGGGLPRANGHEVDARVSTLKSILAQPVPGGAVHPDDPQGIRLLAAGKAWPPGAAKFDYFMRPVKPDGPLGGELIYWERPEGGRVLNAGSIAAGWALHADSRFQTLVANTLEHFGVPRPGGRA